MKQYSLRKSLLFFTLIRITVLVILVGLIILVGILFNKQIPVMFAVLVAVIFALPISYFFDKNLRQNIFMNYLSIKKFRAAKRKKFSDQLKDLSQLSTDADN